MFLSLLYLPSMSWLLGGFDYLNWHKKGSKIAVDYLTMLKVGQYYILYIILHYNIYILYYIILYYITLHYIILYIYIPDIHTYTTCRCITRTNTCKF